MTDLVLRTPTPLAQHPAAIYVARLTSGESRRTMRSCLDRLASLLAPGQDAEGLDWSQVRYPHTVALRTRLLEHYAPASVNKHLSALRGVLKEAWRLGLIAEAAYRRAVDIPSVRSSTIPAGRALDTEELERLFRVCDQDPAPTGRRDGAMLALLYGAGLRRSEAVRLDQADVDLTTGRLVIRQAKGRKDRVVYVPPAARDRLAAWARIRPEGPGAFLTPAHTVRQLSEQSVYNALKRRQHQSGIESLSPHDLRRTYITVLLDADVDVGRIKDLVGHAAVDTTLRYDRRGERGLRDAANQLPMPVIST